MKLQIVSALSAALMLATPALAQPPHHGPPSQDWHGHHWRKGERIPREWWGRDREVDWHAHHLRRPPRGYHWVRDDDGNYVLAAIATGLIASIIMNSEHH